MSTSAEVESAAEPEVPDSGIAMATASLKKSDPPIMPVAAATIESMRRRE